MTAADLQIPESELERIESWRTEALERAGYDSQSAAVVAARHDVDLHAAAGLVEHGCPVEIALRILL